MGAEACSSTAVMTRKRSPSPVTVVHRARPAPTDIEERSHGPDFKSVTFPVNLRRHQLLIRGQVKNFSPVATPSRKLAAGRGDLPPSKPLFMRSAFLMRSPPKNVRSSAFRRRFVVRVCS